MNLAQLLDRLKRDDSFTRNVSAWEVLPPRPAIHAEFPRFLAPNLVAALRRRGIAQLFCHQAEACALASAGRSFVVITPTASGKTLCYNLPVLDAVLRDPQARALYLFPTKALAQDQLTELHDLITELGTDIKTYTFDGDTPETARRAIRQSGHIVITNPDMLHQGILPHHTLWVKLFENLRFIVIDEIHQYRGVFGSHVANVLRRLRRIAAFYGSAPRVICCSATIANPGELASALVGEPVAVVDRNGAPRGEKHFIFYNPPVVNRELGIRRSAVTDTRLIAERFLQADAQQIVFARSRVRVELLLTYLARAKRSGRGAESVGAGSGCGAAAGGLAGAQLDLQGGAVRGYRGGYLPNERRAIERGLRAGTVRAVVSTNALELGIDIGRLDVCVMCGYAGSIASTWQQAGRAGRRQGLSCAVLVATSAPVDQYIISNPDYFFARSPEHATLDPDNLIILASHLKCAAFELPFCEDEEFGGRSVREILDYLVEQSVLHRAEGRYHWMADTYPAEEVSLRSAAPDNVVIVDRSGPDGRIIGEMDLFSAQELLHDDAIYLHGGQQYHVDKLDWERREAYVQPVDVDHYTDAQRKTELKTLDVEEHGPIALGARGLGELGLVSKVTVYKKIKLGSHENVGAGRVHLPEMEMHTTGFWWELPDTLHDELAAEGLALGDALQGLAHLLGEVAAVFVMADPADLHAAPMIRSPFTDKPTLYLYDSVPGGAGFARRIYQQIDEIAAAGRRHLEACPCKEGCPSCVGAPTESGSTAKRSALRVLVMLAQSPRQRATPTGGQAAGATEGAAAAE